MPACWNDHITRPEQSNALGPDRPTSTANRSGSARPGRRRSPWPPAGRRRPCRPGGMAPAAEVRPGRRDRPAAARRARRDGRRGGWPPGLPLGRGQRLVLRFDDRRSAPAAGFAWTAGRRAPRRPARRRSWRRRPIAPTPARPVRPAALISAVVLHLGRHLGGHHPLHRELVDEVLRRVGGQDRAQTVGAAAHVLRGSNLVDGGLEGRQLRLGGVHGGQVGGVLRLGCLLSCQLVVRDPAARRASPRWSVRPAETAR